MLETAEAAIAEILRTQLLERIQELPPAFFERPVVDLIVAMGYGGLSWSRLSEQLFRVDKWSVCRG
jgi:restriction endonuclease Mrr